MTRELFTDHALEVAPRLLGARLTVDGDDGPVTIRITEVEAYHGVGVPGPYDAGSHSRDRRTERNAAMFGPPGHAYVYFSYGMHFALNMVCSPEGTASGVLIRSGEVIEGAERAVRRRLAKRRTGSSSNRIDPGGNSTGAAGAAAAIPHRMLARGPGNLATALGITRPEHNGRDLFAPPFRFVPAEAPARRPEETPAETPPEKVAASAAEIRVASGPRVGVAGVAGGPAFPWRFWIPGDPTVSAFRPGRGAPR